MQEVPGCGGLVRCWTNGVDTANSGAESSASPVLAPTWSSMPWLWRSNADIQTTARSTTPTKERLTRR